MFEVANMRFFFKSGIYSPLLVIGQLAILITKFEKLVQMWMSLHVPKCSLHVGYKWDILILYLN
jgi:hypothetical protein